MKIPNSITLNGHHFDAEELIAFSREQLLRPDISGWESEIFRFILEWVSGDDFVIVRTSGSTGIPKTIEQPKERMINSALMTAEYFGLDERTNALLCLPVSYIAGKMMIVRAFVTGMNLIIVEPSSDPFSALWDKIHFAAITPFQLAHSLTALEDRPVDAVIIGGGEIPYDLEMQCQQVSSNLYATYAMTETSSHIAIRAVNGIHKSPLYEVLKNVRVSVDERSCLVINAPHLTPELLVTNDIVDIKDDTHFEWIGRLDSVINSGGLKIFPEQVEKKLFSLIPLRFFIAGLPDVMLGEKVTLFIEGEPYNPVQLQDLKRNIDSLLPRFELPREIVFIPVFDLSSAGKILKKLIVSGYLNGL